MIKGKKKVISGNLDKKEEVVIVLLCLIMGFSSAQAGKIS
jgi:hypothetical protein